MQRPIHQRLVLWALLLSSVLGVVVFYGLTVTGESAEELGLFKATIRYFAFYTISSNVLGAVFAGTLLFGGEGRLARFARRPTVQAAVSVYLFFVGLGLWVLLGGMAYESFENVWWWIGDLTPHTLSPLLGLAWFFVGLPKGTLGGKDPFAWLWYPIAWYGFWMLAGPWLGTYPYPFMDVPEIGPAAATVWVGILLAVFLTLGFAFVGLDRLLGRRKSAA